MMARKQCVRRLVSQVLDFQVHRDGTPIFRLGDDLDRLERILYDDVPEAVVFYSARILEALAGHSVARLRQRASSNVFANLQLLEHYNRLGTTTRYIAHTLRRLGNQVRHLHGVIRPEEANLAVLLVEEWLRWFFCVDSNPALVGLTEAGDHLELSDDGECRELLRLIGRLEQSVDRHGNLNSHPALLKTPVLVAILVENHLAHQRREEADALLRAGLDRFRDDLRLIQLKGLYHSSNDELKEALTWLEPIHKRYPEDDETAGITAGAYKRRWWNDRRCTSDLVKANRAYRAAWEKSSENAYLGINTAATALWLGQPDAVAIASKVEKLLRKRITSLPPELKSDPDGDFNYWDRVTLAEALLIQGDLDRARQEYARAFRRYPDLTGCIESTRRQMNEHLRFLGLPPDLA